ncbi:MAG TPA: hypothetical protein VNZ59_10015, partial [Burkholderiales bacterium]|nr:hypothetical protein [Burkholderiales bacterium]
MAGPETPLISAPGPVGAFFAALELFRIVGGKHEAARQRLFQQHRERNEARGWKLGDNILQAAQSGEIPGRGSKQRKEEQAKRDRFWKLERELIRRSEASLEEERRKIKEREQREKEEAANREAARKKRVEEQQRAARARGADRTFTRGAYSVSPLGNLIMGIGDVWLRQEFARLDEQWRRRARLRTNRRGALASRPRALSTTNRRGALAQRPLGQSSAASAEPANRPRSQSGAARPVSSPTSSAPLESTASASDAAARQVMGSSPAMPSAAASAARSASGTQALLRAAQGMAVGSLFNSASRVASLSRVTSSSRLTSSSSTRLSTSSSTRLSDAQALTGLNSLGVAS